MSKQKNAIRPTLKPNAMLCRLGLIIKVNDLINYLGKATFNKTLRKMTLVFKQFIGKDKKLLMYKYSTINGERYIHFPRFYAENFAGICNLTVNINEPERIEYDFDCDLFPNQVVIMNHFMEHIYTPENAANGTASRILKLTAGQGKTFVSMALGARLGVRMCYVCTNSYMLNQAIDDFKVGFGESTDMGAYKSSKDAFGRKVLNEKGRVDYKHIFDITFVIIDTAMNLTGEFWNNFGLVVFDECHEYCTDKRSNIFWNCHTKYMLGLSATPNHRTDKFDTVAHKQIGPVLDAGKLPGYDHRLVDWKGGYKIIKYAGPAEYSTIEYMTVDGKTMTCFTTMLKKLIMDPYRNKMIIQEIKELFKQGHNIYCFSEYTEHIQIITDMVKEIAPELLPYMSVDCNDCDSKDGIESTSNNNEKPKLSIDNEASTENSVKASNNSVIAKALTGGASNDDRNDALRSRIILTTYAFSSTGTSIKKQDALLLMSPRKSKALQLVARILRAGSDESIYRRIVDIVDPFSTKQLSKRVSAYKHYGLEHISTEVVSYSEIDL